MKNNCFATGIGGASAKLCETLTSDESAALSPRNNKEIAWRAVIPPGRASNIEEKRGYLIDNIVIHWRYVEYMAIFGQQSQPGKASIDWGRGFAELSFIPVASDWIELLASRLAQPLMFVSSLYIVAETTIPGLATWSFLDNATKLSISLGPDIILPGCFLQAKDAWQEQKKHRAYLLFALFGLCVILLAVTLGSALIWHFGVAVTDLILFTRCCVGIAYTVILKIDKEQHVAVIAQPTQPTLTQEDLTVLIAQALRIEVVALRDDLRKDVQRFVQIAQQSVRVEEIAQSPEAIQIDTAQPTQRPAITQRSTMRTAHNETAQSEPLRRDDEEDCAVEDDDAQGEDTDVVPIAQQETNIMPVVRTAQPAQKDVRTRIFDFLDAYYAEHGPTARITNLEIQEGAPASKNKVVEYRREYDREKRGGV